MRALPASWKVSFAALLSISPTFAQTSPDTDGEASVDTSDALPGIHRIGIPAMPAPHYGAAATASYGYTEPQTAGSDPHHRVGGSLALGLAPFSFAQFGLRVDYRHDIHGQDAEGSDQSSSLDLTPLVRSGSSVGHGVHLGGEVRVPFLGTAGVDDVPAPIVDARFLAAYLGLPTWRFAMHAGFKLGSRGDVTSQSDNLRAGDRVALGLSEFDAVLLGLGLSKRVASTELLAEATSEMLVGSGAPPFSESPFRIAAGARQSLAPYLALSALVEVSPLARAPSAAGDPLVPIEPRVSAMLSLVVRLPAKKTAHAPAVPQQTKNTPPPPPPVEVVVPTTSIRVIVADQTGHPISDANVYLEYPATAGTPAQKIAIPLLSTNLYVMDGLPLGEATLTIDADLLHASSQVVKLIDTTPTEVSVSMSAEAAERSRLRGLVRSYSGEGIVASVSVSPGSHSATCNEQGEFEIMLPPGNYEVTISSDGFQTQKRSLRVQDEGVTVLNADLQKE